MSAHLYSSDRPDAYLRGRLYRLSARARGRRAPGESSSRAYAIRGCAASAAAARRPGGELKLEGKYPGLEFAAEGKAKDADAFVQARLYLVDQRLYQVIAMGRKGEVPQGEVNRFLESFRLVPTSEVGTLQFKSGGSGR